MCPHILCSIPWWMPSVNLGWFFGTLLRASVSSLHITPAPTSANNDLGDLLFSFSYGVRHSAQTFRRVEIVPTWAINRCMNTPVRGTPEEPLRRGGAQGVAWVKPSQLDPEDATVNIITFAVAYVSSAVSPASTARSSLSQSTLSLPPCSTSTTCSSLLGPR